MQCFNHPDRPALGLCKSCGKGLCRECLAEIPNGLACRGSCEERAGLINRIIDHNQKVIAVANTQMRASGLFMLVIGLVFCLFGFLPLIISNNTSTLFIGIMGLICMAYGLSRLVRKSLYPKAE